MSVALSSTIYNFDIDLADADRQVYETLALRVARQLYLSIGPDTLTGGVTHHLIG